MAVWGVQSNFILLNGFSEALFDGKGIAKIEKILNSLLRLYEVDRLRVMQNGFVCLIKLEVGIRDVVMHIGHLLVLSESPLIALGRFIITL